MPNDLRPEGEFLLRTVELPLSSIHTDRFLGDNNQECRLRLSYHGSPAESIGPSPTERGSLVDQGRMRAQDVGNAIIGLADVISGASRIVCGVSHVTPLVEDNFAKGSFEIVFVVSTAAEPVLAINDLVLIMVLLFGSDHPGLLSGLWDWIKSLARLGRPRPRVPHPTGQQIVVVGDGNKVVVIDKMERMLEDDEIRNGIESVLAPLFSGTVERVQLGGVTINRDEAADIVFYLRSQRDRPLDVDVK